MIVICGRNEELKASLENYDWPEIAHTKDRFSPEILGFVSNVDDYMGAADCLVTKAGPGSIAEAMIKGLPCLLTSFVPGQEEGNITFVENAGAGAYVSDEEPNAVAETVANWLAEPATLEKMSLCAQNAAKPKAALDIARKMCDCLELGVELKEACPNMFSNVLDDDSCEFNNNDPRLAPPSDICGGSQADVSRSSVALEK